MDGTGQVRYCAWIRPCDIMHPTKKEEKTEMSVQDYNEAFTIAMDDVVEKRYDYRRRYEEWLKQK